MKSNSDRLNELLSAYIDGEVTADEKAEVEELLRKDQVAANLYGKLSMTKNLLGTMQPLSAPVVLNKKLTQQFKVLKQQNIFSRLRSIFKPISVPVPVFTYLGALIILSIIFFYSSSVLFIQPTEQPNRPGQAGTAGRSAESEAPAEQFALEQEKKSKEEETTPSGSIGLLRKDHDREDSEADNTPLMADAAAESEDTGEAVEGYGTDKTAPATRTSEETLAARGNEMRAGTESSAKPAAPSADDRLKTITGEAPLVMAEPKPTRSRDEATPSKDEVTMGKTKAGIVLSPETGEIKESSIGLAGGVTITRTTYRAEILNETIPADSNIQADEDRQVGGNAIHSVFRGGKADKRLAQYFKKAQQPAQKQKNTISAPIPDIDFQAIDPEAGDRSFIVTGEMQVADNGKILQLRISGHPAARFLIDAYADHLQTTPMLPAYTGDKPVPVLYRFIATIHKAN